MIRDSLFAVDASTLALGTSSLLNSCFIACNAEDRIAQHTLLTHPPSVTRIELLCARALRTLDFMFVRWTCILIVVFLSIAKSLLGLTALALQCRELFLFAGIVRYAELVEWVVGMLLELLVQ